MTATAPPSPLQTRDHVYVVWAVRRAATRVYNGMLRVLLGFHGTDTHGLKAFRRELVVPVVQRCIVDEAIITDFAAPICAWSKSSFHKSFNW